MWVEVTHSTGLLNRFKEEEGVAHIAETGAGAHSTGHRSGKEEVGEDLHCKNMGRRIFRTGRRTVLTQALMLQCGDEKKSLVHIISYNWDARKIKIPKKLSYRKAQQKEVSLLCEHNGCMVSCCIKSAEVHNSGKCS